VPELKNLLLGNAKDLFEGELPGKYGFKENYYGIVMELVEGKELYDIV